jgi:hypothetical protein
VLAYFTVGLNYGIKMPITLAPGSEVGWGGGRGRGEIPV